MPDSPVSQLISRWFEFLPPDPVADLLLSLALLLGVVLSVFGLRLRGGGHLFVLILFFLICEGIMVAADNAVIFYLAWEIAALLAWGIGRLDAGDEPETQTVWPVQVAGLIASIMMIFALWALARDSGTFVVSRMRPSQSGWVSFLLLGAVLLKTLTLVGYAWRESPQRVAWASSAFLVTGGAYMIGVYPFARLLMGIYSDLGDAQWRDLAVWVGLGGAVACALAALGEDDIKRALSYGALGQLLGIFAALAVPSQAAVTGGLLVVLVYTFSVASLYLAFGIVEAATGERRLSALGGLGASVPGIALLAIFAALALAGIPPLGAFLGQMILLSTYFSLNAVLVPFLHLLGLILTVLYLFRLVRSTFFGPPSHDGTVTYSRFSLVGLLIVAGLVLALAALPFWSDALLNPIVGYLVR